MAKLAVVTGASSGIGRAFAERLAADGYDLVLVARRRERLEDLAASLADVDVRPLAADLATDDGIDAVAAVCATEPVTMLVNNAGVAHYMALADLPAAKAAELVHVKVVAPTVLTRAVLPGMLERGQGTIVARVPRMTADEVVTASLRGLELGEVVCAPGVEDPAVLHTVFAADLVAFGSQSAGLATRYRSD